MQKIELLAPAKNLECGIAAIDHGADAVYIGAERFGARVAAGNSVEDIASLCRYAHVFGAKVYVTVNTIVYDDELEETRQLIERLKDAGVDALLVQDMGIVEWSVAHDESPIPLHASTQTDNRTAAKVRWLRDVGFLRVVLARELSAEEISAIHKAVPDVELEVFVHGALCVSYSGVCYASQYCFGRSANRGACAQFCRLKFDLQDADGQVLEHGRYLLSLKDLCQIDALEQLMEAGAVSFKIEGRLKDVYYVKNVVAAYSQRLNEIIGHHPEKYCRASKGRCTYTFVPNLKKTFNRGFTHYFLNGRQANIASFDTPKALGEYVGKVKEIRGNSFIVAGTSSFANGDGLCFFREEKRPGEKERRKESEKEGRREDERGGMKGKELVLEGFRVNKVVNNRLFPLNMPQNLRPGTALYRNNDQEFERLLSKPSSERKIEVNMSLATTAEGFVLSMTALDGCLLASASTDFAHQPAQKPQTDNIRTQLSKLGGTPFECSKVTVSDEAARLFIPSSVLANLRRKVTEEAVKEGEKVRKREEEIERNRGEEEEGRNEAKEVREKIDDGCSLPVPPLQDEYQRYPYLLNVANQQARSFYERCRVTDVQPAFELQHGGQQDHHGKGSFVNENASGPLLMQCRHCVRYSLGMCLTRHAAARQWHEPLFLVLPDGRRFRLQFDCKQCQMNVYVCK